MNTVQQTGFVPNLQYPLYYDNFSYAPENSEHSTLKRRLFQGLFDLVGIVVTFVLFVIIFTAVNPRIQFATCDMSDIVFPKFDDTVELYVVGLYGGFYPIIVIILVELFNANLYCCQNKTRTDRRGRLRRFAITLFHGLSLFIFGAGLTLLLTEIGKRAVGRLRPHFLSVCNPDLTQISCTSTAQTGSVFNSFSTGGSFCRGDAKDVKEARLSFPSGHASFSAYTMLFLIIYLEARLRVLYLRYAKVLIQLSAFVLAYYTAMSRIVDYAHRGSDVIGGAILGIVIALLMTLLVGRVLWVYELKEDDDEIDYKDARLRNKNQNSMQMENI